MKVKFLLAELGTVKDTKGVDFEAAGIRLTSNVSTAFGPNAEDGPRPGFALSKYSEVSQCLMLRYLYQGTPFTRSVLLLERGNVERMTLGSDGGVVLRQGFVLFWPGHRLAATVQLSPTEADEALTLLANGLYRYAKGQGFVMVTLSDEAMMAFRKLRGGHDIELEYGGSSRIKVEDVDSVSFDRNLGQLALVDEDGDPIPLEDAKDRFVAVGTNLETSKPSPDTTPGTRMSHLRQKGKATEFTLERGLPDEEELDNLTTLPRVADAIRFVIDYLVEKGFLNRVLTLRPDLTRIKVKPLEEFGRERPDILPPANSNVGH